MKKYKAVFPLAGMGTRFLPITKSIAKEMLPIEGKPAIEYAVRDAKEAYASEMVFILPGQDESNYKQSLINYFNEFEPPFKSLLEKKQNPALKSVKSLSEEINISRCHQSKALGLGHAVYQAKELVGTEEPFFVLLPDDIIDSSPSSCKLLLDMTEKYNADGAILLQEVPKDKVHQYGVISGKAIDSSGDVWQIDNMVEKPDNEEAPSNLAIVGRYFLPGSIFDEIENLKPGKGGEIQLTDAILKLLKSKKILGVKLKGQRLDTGKILGYELACLWYGLKRKGDRAEILRQLNEWSDELSKK